MGMRGRTLTLDGAPGYEVHGVLPAGFAFPAAVDLYRSLYINPNLPNHERRDLRTVDAVGRLRPGVSIDTAAAAVAAVSAQLAREFPDTNSGLTLTATGLREVYTGSLEPYLFVLLGASALVLLVASTNVAGVLLARGLERRRELAVRVALGAGTRHLAGLAVREGLVLAAAGGVVGLAVAAGVLRALPSIPGLALPPWMAFSIDPRVTGLIAVVTLVGGLAAALPVLRVHGAAQSALGSRSRTAGRGERRLQRYLTIAEVTIAVALTAGALTVVRSATALSRPAIGLAPDNLLTFRTALTWYTYPIERVLSFHTRALEELRALPGVTAAALNSNLPLGGLGGTTPVHPQTDTQSDAEARGNPYVNYQRVNASYFADLGIAVRRGRSFAVTDRPDGPPVAVVSTGLAARLWGSADPIGRRLRTGRDDRTPWLEVVGVVDDVHHASPVAPAGPDLYVTIDQFPTANVFYAVRTTGSPKALAATARAAIWTVDRDQAVFDVASFDERVRRAVWRQRAVAAVFAGFAAIAVLLAGIGVYGLVAGVVGQRARETALRLALGASPGGLLVDVVREAVALAAAGGLVGVLAGWGVGRVLSGLVPGVTQAPPWLLAAAPVLAVGVAALAALGPASRVRRTDPCETLKAE